MRAELPEINDTTILKALVGSTAHGISIGNDDRDEMGVCVEPMGYAMGLNEFEQFTYRSAVERTGDHNARSEKGDLDLTVYSLRKYVRLALKGNPSILSLLFAQPPNLIVKTGFGDALQTRAAMFISKKAGGAFLGYMQAQRQRLLHERGGRHGSRDQQFDLKYASHMLRLGIQGVELMQTGRFSIPMEESKAAMIRDVRRGLMPQQNLLSLAGDIERELKDAIDATELPEDADRAGAEAWMLETYAQAWEKP